MRIVIECEEKLLDYASTGINAENFKLKSIHTAIFYFQKAFDTDQKNAISPGSNREYHEGFAQLYLQASTSPKECYTKDQSTKYLEQAQENIEKLDDSNHTKADLFYKMMEIRVDNLMGRVGELEPLRKVRMEFEQHIRCRRKNNLSGGENDFESAVIQVVTETKRVLDSSINDFKLKVFKKHHNEMPFCHFPCPKTLRNSRGFCNEEKMRYLLEERYQFTNFSSDFPKLFNFLVESQHTFGDLQLCFDIRNAKEHSTEYRALLKEKFPKESERTAFVRAASEYAAKVWNKFQSEIKEYYKKKRSNK